MRLDLKHYDFALSIIFIDVFPNTGGGKYK